MLHLIANTAACHQSRQLCSQKQNSGSVLYFTAAQKSTIPLTKFIENVKIKILDNLPTYLPTYLPTPWCRTLFEKLNSTQPIEKYPAFITVLKSPPLDPVMSQLNPVRPHRSLSP
jgi:hypothetical protein